ncbi:MAG: esterase-like activity of phytase family protein, partial [Pseudomonadota bacterium]|nr:esterase-like activity of phytase family protein [Pseudomonadota bacterium]
MKHTALALALFATMLTGCGDDGTNGRNGVDGQNGTNGANGQNGTNGQSTLVQQIHLDMGDQRCLLGGLQIHSGLDNDANGNLDTAEIKQTSHLCHPHTFASVGVALPYSI